jgi:hypothetical protein
VQTVSLRNKEKGFPTIHQQEYFDPKGKNIIQLGQTDSTGNAV